MFRHGDLGDEPDRRSGEQSGLDEFMRSLGPDFAKDLDPGAAQMRPGDAERLLLFTMDENEAEGFLSTLISYDPYDARLFREFYEASEEMRLLYTDQNAPATFGAMLMDLFLVFYKVTPTLIETSRVEPGHRRVNGPFLYRVLSDEQTLLTRISTCLDELLSGQAAIEAARAFLAEVKSRPELEEWIDDQAKPREDDPEPPSPGDPDSTGGNEIASPDTASGQGPGSSAGGDQVSGDDPGDNQEQRPPPPVDLTAAVRSLTEAAEREAREIVAATAAWGFEPGDLRRVPLGERIELAKKLRTRRLKDLARMLGRMKTTKRGVQKKKLRADHGEKYSLTISGDLHRTLPSERASAFGTNDEYRELDFYRKLAENNVPSYDLRTTEQVGRGPVVAMIDASYSMSGERMEWASSLALALAHPGTKKPSRGDRHLYAIFFNTRIVLEVELLPGENDLQKLVSVGTVDPAGGTRYTAPMTRALEVSARMGEAGHTNRHGRPSNRRGARRSKKGPADFLLVTDGECDLDKEFISKLLGEKTRKGFRIVSVLIGNNPKRAEGLQKFSDLVVPVAYLGGSSYDEAAKIFDALGTPA